MQRHFRVTRQTIVGDDWTSLSRPLRAGMRRISWSVAALLLATSGSTAMAQYGNGCIADDFPARTDGSIFSDTRVGVTAKFDHVSDDFASENGGGMKLGIGQAVGDRGLLQAGADFTYLEDGQNYSVFFGASILNYVRGETLTEWLSSSWVLDYLALEPFGTNDWGARTTTGVRLTVSTEVGLMAGYGFDGGTTPGGLNDYFAGYLQFSPSNSIATIVYLGGGDDPDSTIFGGEVGVKFGSNGSVIFDLGGDDNGLFGTMISFQYLLGAGAPQNDGLGGGAYQIHRTGTMCSVPFWQAQGRRR